MKKTLEYNFLHPPQGFTKLNFDGASKGNPDLAGLGGLIWDTEGKNLKVFVAACGTTTNNVADFLGLEKGLHLVSKMGITNL